MSMKDYEQSPVKGDNKLNTNRSKLTSQGTHSQVSYTTQVHIGGSVNSKTQATSNYTESRNSEKVRLSERGVNTVESPRKNLSEDKQAKDLNS